MSLPTYDDESWLRSELPGLLAGEPTMPTAAVTDDVRRGQARLRTVRRRRTAAIAVAALLVAVAIPVGLLVRPTAQSQVGPSTGTDVPDVPGVSRQWLEGISPALGAQVGWVVDWPDSTVYGDVATGLQLDLTIVPGQQVATDPPRFAVPSGPYPQTASLRLWFAPKGKAPGAAMAECPADRCPRDLPDRRFPTYLDQSATAGNGTSLAAGTLIVDRSYDSGRFVELVSVPAQMTPSSPSDQLSQNVLSYGLAAPFLDVIRAPEAAPVPSTSPTTSASPSPYTTRFDKDGITYVAPESALGPAVAALLPGTVTERNPSTVSAVGITRGFRIVRDGVGTYVRVMWIGYAGGDPVLAPPSVASPCGTDGPSCTVLRPWTMTSAVGTAYPGVASVIERTGAGSSTAAGYSGRFTIRGVQLQRGSTVIVIDADSRDIDLASGDWTRSTAPGLSVDELLALAAKVPMPVRYQGLADTPWSVSGSGSASASASG